MDLEFSNPSGALWLLAACATLAAGLWLAFWRMRAALRFADRGLLPRIAPGLSLSRGVWRAVLVGAAAALVGVALMDPRAGDRTEQVVRKGADVMFVVDVSRSMLAEDATPSRLARAKAFISDAIDALGGDRVGLVDFAGVAAVRAPLTLNYDALKTAVDGLEPKDSRRGGSMLGDAIRLAMDSFTSDDAGRAIVVLSDGEDMGSDPISAAREAGERGVRIITVGLGDARDGARVPVGDGQARRYLVHEGQEVWSRMDAQTLREIADAADGVFVPAGTAQVELGEILTRSLDDLSRTEGEAASVTITAPLYQWPAGLALALLVTEASLSAARRVPSAPGMPAGALGIAESMRPHGRQSRRREPAAQRPRERSARSPAGSALGAIAMIAAVTASLSARADAPVTEQPAGQGDAAPRHSASVGRGQIDRAGFRAAAARGAQLMSEGSFTEAAAAYGAAMAADPTSAEAAYNFGVASYRAGQHDVAAGAFAEAAALGEARLAADAMFNQGNATYQGALKALGSGNSPADGPGTTAPGGAGRAAPPDIGAAADAVERALTHYKDAIEANPEDADARANAELAHALLKQLRQMQQQQQQQEQNRKENEKEQEKQSQDQKDQSGEQTQPKQESTESNQQDGQKKDQQGEPQECDGAQNPQGDPKDGSKGSKDPNPAQGNEQQQQQQKPKDQPGRDGSEPPSRPQSKAGDQGQQGSEPKPDPTGQKDQGTDDAADPREQGADKSPRQGKVESQKDTQGSTKDPTDGRAARAMDPVPGAPMGKDEAERLLQAVRDRAKLRAETRERAERSRQMPAPRDW